MALVAVIWKLIYSPDQLGLLNSFLNAVTFGHFARLGDPPWDASLNRHIGQRNIHVVQAGDSSQASAAS